MGRTTRHQATVAWDADKRDLRAHTIELAGQHVAGSGMPELGGDASRADPEELFVESISACHMLWFLDHARRERLRVLSYEDHPEGTMDGVRFLEVVLRPRVTFASGVSHDVLDRLHRQAHEACFIANSVACEIRIDLDASGGPHMDAAHGGDPPVQLRGERSHVPIVPGALMDGHAIRGAHREDRAAIAAIYNEAIAEGASTFETQPRTAGDIDAWLRATRHPVLVAEREGDSAGTIAGWARLAPYSTRPCYAGIAEASVYVSPTSRGQGIGSALASALRGRAEQAGLTKLIGKCLTLNDAAARLVARHGFREVGVHRRHGQIDGHWHDVLLVELLLHSAPAR